MQSKIAGLTLFIADHPTMDPGLMALFNRKVEMMLQYHDLLTEIINYQK